MLKLENQLVGWDAKVATVASTNIPAPSNLLGEGYRHPRQWLEWLTWEAQACDEVALRDEVVVQYELAGV
jgi:hypothetical protein